MAIQLAVGVIIAQDQDLAQLSVGIVAAPMGHKWLDAMTAPGQEHNPTDTTASTTGMSTVILMGKASELATASPPKCSILSRLCNRSIGPRKPDELADVQIHPHRHKNTKNRGANRPSQQTHSME